MRRWNRGAILADRTITVVRASAASVDGDALACKRRARPDAGAVDVQHVGVRGDRIRSFVGAGEHMRSGAGARARGIAGRALAATNGCAVQIDHHANLRRLIARRSAAKIHRLADVKRRPGRTSRCHRRQHMAQVVMPAIISGTAIAGVITTLDRDGRRLSR